LVASPATGIGIFTSNLTGLLPVTTYYVKAYATNSSVTSYGNQITFTTSAVLPTLAATTAATAITATTATSGGNITSDGGATVTERGICYATTTTPTIANSRVVDPGTGAGSFISNMTGLIGYTTYYVRAYATNSAGTAYGAQISFTTLRSPPTLVTVAATAIGGASAASGGSMTWNGGGYSNYQAYGVAYSTTPGSATPTKIATNSANGAVNPAVNITPWVTNVTGLLANTTYYIRAYLDIYPSGTGPWQTVYGNELSFTTTAPSAPVVASTNAITAILSTTATSGGAITSDGGSPITAKGVCWGYTNNPVLGASNFTSNGTGTASFVSSLTGLSGSTTYYVRAYATNAIGTTYAPTSVTFTTNIQSLYTLGQNVGYGWVAYIDPATGAGFIVSPDIAPVSPATSFNWGCSGTHIAVGTALGTGMANTSLIIASCPGVTAASSAKSYSVTYGGTTYANWYLPSSGEWAYIAAIYSFAGITGTVNYFTSSEYGTNYTYAATYFVNSSTPYSSGATRTAGQFTSRIRAIMDFGPAPIVVPTIIQTDPVTSITATGGTSGGSIAGNGGGAITAKGVCWSISANPTTANSKTIDGTGNTAFTSLMTGMTTGTTYHVRSYATNSAGTAYGNDVTFVPVAPGFPIVSTTALSGQTGTGAASGGTIVSNGGSTILANGVCWSTTTGPTIASSKTTDAIGNPSFASAITGLTAGTTYYIRAYATNVTGTSYGNELTYMPISTATLTTTAITNLASTSVTTGGNIASENGSAVTVRGVCWSTTSPATVGVGNFSNDGTGPGAFVSSIGGLTPGLLYYVRAYATNGAGTSYGNEVSFTTVPLALATVTTTAITNLMGTAATTGGNVTADGGNAVTSRGVCYDITANPDITSITTITIYDVGSGLGTYVSNLTGLTNGQLYHVRAFATNAIGTSYGADISFTPTGNSIPTLTTATITSPTPTGGTFGGNITSDGGLPVTARGVCWSNLSATPTILDAKTIDGSGAGVFTSNVTGLTEGFGYWVVAYATNSLGTAYGQVEYYVPVGPPILTTMTLSYTAPATTATSGVNVTNDGGSPLTALGIVWGPTSGPTTASNAGMTIENVALGWWSFQSTLTGLTSGTVYVRAYATNAIGTSYGNEISFNPAVASIPTVNTGLIINKIGAIAEGSGEVTSDGGDPIITSGLVWSTTLNPDLVSNNLGISTDGWASGLYYSTITGLTIGTTYHVKAYATTNAGTGYGADVSFVATAATMGQVITGGNIMGNVFSVDGTGLHGLIAYPNMPYGSSDWGCTSTNVVGTGTAVGTGMANTTAINSNITSNLCTSPSTYAVFAPTLTTWIGVDWYLPSKDELTLLWTNRVAAGLDAALTPNVPLWSSSQVDATHAWSFDGTTMVNTGLKNAMKVVWPIRSF
jgi:hypothetical protein